MSNKKFKEIVEEVLRADDRLWNKEKTEFNIPLLFNFIDKMDETIIGLLFNREETRNKFFLKINDAYIFKTKEFKFFIEENKVFNSYTSYPNRIGLFDGKDFIMDRGDVVINFPFKDCILEGGQTTEQGIDTYYEYDEKVTKTQEKQGWKAGSYNKKQDKRKEIFFNEILAQDEIDRLLDEKAFVNWKRYTKSGVEKVGKLKRDENGLIRENLIIKGNNLLALHSIKSQFMNKVNLIYIDPPYNPDSAANTFIYNNSFNRSTWLTFIKNRVEIGKDLLSDDGLLCMSIDHNELFYAGVLLDEIFGRHNRIGVVAVETNPGGRSDSKFFATSNEYFIVYAKDINKAVINDLKLEDNELKDYKYEDSISRYKLVPLRRTGSNSTPDKRPNLCFPIYYNPDKDDISLEEKEGYIKIMPMGSNSIMRVWRWSKKKIMNSLDDIEVKKTKGGYSVYVKDRIRYVKKPKTMWYGKKYDASSHGTKLLQKMKLTENFSYPKSIYLIKDILQVLSNKDSIILDFFAGSGTTAHAVIELNHEDNGNRKFILVEQMDYIETITIPRVQQSIDKNDINTSFIYFELAKWNEKAKEEIMECNNLEELKKLFTSLCDKYYLNYNIRVNDFKNKTIEEEEFKKLPLEEQKKMFLTMLDLNQLYVQKTEMEDKKFGISEEDQRLTKMFYGEE